MKQAERIHHRCRCLDRNFTFEEWSEYLRENPSGGSLLPESIPERDSETERVSRPEAINSI